MTHFYVYGAGRSAAIRFPETVLALIVALLAGADLVTLVEDEPGTASNTGPQTG